MWWTIHIVLIFVEILIGVGLWVVFSTWNDYINVLRYNRNLVEVTLYDDTKFVAWINERSLVDFNNLQDVSFIYFQVQDGLKQVSKGEITKIRRITKISEILRKTF